MAGRNGFREEEQRQEEMWAAVDDLGEVEDADWVDDVPPHLRAVAHASEHGDVGSIRNALDCYSFDIDEPLEDGDTAIHLCCLYGHLPCVQFLVERGANIEVKDEDAAIPLHDACAGGFTNIVQYLLNVGNAECVQRMLNTVDLEGDTPLHNAARGGHAHVIQVLLAAGASPVIKNIYGEVPAELAEPDTDAKRILEIVMLQYGFF